MRSLIHPQHHHHHRHCFSRPRLFFLRRLFSLLPQPSKIRVTKSNAKKRGFRLQHRIVQVRAFDEDSFGVSSFDDWADNQPPGGYLISSSDGEDSDGDYVLNPVSDVDLPSSNLSNHDSLTITAHRLAIIAKNRRKHRMRLGVFINMGLVGSLTLLLFFVDWCAWKIVRLPLAPFYLSRPFFISIALASFAGYISVPFLKALKIHCGASKEGPPLWHSKKRVTPTMGGLFFIPIGVGVAKFVAGFSSVEVSAAAVATLAFASIGLLDDLLGLLKKRRKGLPAWVKLALEITIGALFAFWLDTTSISSPYSMYTFLN